MTHASHPYAHRLGILRDWKSRWSGPIDKYQEYLKADVLLREYLEEKLRSFHVSSVEMERTEKTLRIIIKTSRPGMIIGRSGEGSVQLKNDVLKFIRKKKLIDTEEVKIDIEEVKHPESDATIVAHMIAETLEKRFPFRRIMKQSIDKVMANRDVLGAKISLSGRLGNADMSRKESIKKGRIPLQTFRADVDYANIPARLPSYGLVGVKVWIYKGEIFDKE
jgi:small subunit ribosomal protein S3